MRSKIHIASIVAWSSLLGLAALFSVVGYHETHYNRNGEVVEIQDGIVTIEDTTGNEWRWETKPSEEAFQVGDNVRLKMFTNGTDYSIYDDKVLRIEQISAERSK